MGETASAQMKVQMQIVEELEKELSKEQVTRAECWDLSRLFCTGADTFSTESALGYLIFLKE